MIKFSSFSQLILFLSLITISNLNNKKSENNFPKNKEQTSKNYKYYIYPIILKFYIT